MHSGARTKTISIGALIAALTLLAGCGSSGSGSTSSTTSAASATSTSSTESTTTPTSTSTTTSTASSTEKVPTIDIPLASSTNLNPIAATYTCDGANISPPISWSQIPPHTVELQLFVFNFLPVGGKLFADWAVAGLSPSLHGLLRRQTPRGGDRGHQQPRTGALQRVPRERRQHTLCVSALRAAPAPRREARVRRQRDARTGPSHRRIRGATGVLLPAPLSGRPHS